MLKRFLIKKNNIKIKTSTICCYPADENFVLAHKEEILKKIDNFGYQTSDVVRSISFNKAQSLLNAGAGLSRSIALFSILVFKDLLIK